MRKIFISVLLSALCVCAQAQITSYKIPAQSEPKERVVKPYDSLFNVSSMNYYSLVGQRVQILPSADTKDRAEDAPTLFFNGKVVEPATRYSTWEPRSRKDAFDNMIFDIVGLDSAKTSMPGYYEYYLLVKNETYTEPHRLLLGMSSFSGSCVFSAPPRLMIEGYFLKMRQLNVGKKLLNKVPRNKAYDSDVNEDSPIVYDMQTGNPLGKISENHLWTVKDVAMVEYRIKDRYSVDSDYRTLNRLCYILSSDSIPLAFAKFVKSNFIDYEKLMAEETAKQKAEAERAAANKKAAQQRAAKKKEADRKAAEERKQWEEKIRKTYSAEDANLIINGKVRIGFTTQMCLSAWGAPTKINTTKNEAGTSEQWVYHHTQYLYFENGILVTIQE